MKLHYDERSTMCIVIQKFGKMYFLELKILKLHYSSRKILDNLENCPPSKILNRTLATAFDLYLWSRK